MTRSALAVAVALVTLLVASPAASAHAILLRAEPAIGGVTETAPAELLLQFTEPVEPRFSQIEITDADGRSITRGGVTIGDDAAALAVALQPSLPDGWYRVEWRALSVDGHRIRGAFPFGVGDPGPAPEIGALADGGAATGSIALRFLMLAGLILGAGLAAFRLALVRTADAVPARALWRIDGSLLGMIVVALVSTPLYIAHETALFGDRSMLDVGWIADNLRNTAFGRGYTDLVVVLAIFAGLTVVALRTRRRWIGIAAVVAGAASLLVPGLVGHPGQGSVPALAVPLDWLHLCAAATWTGGLLGLALTGRDAASRIAPRFSTVALLAVIALGWTGVIAALENVKSISNLVDTGYGRSLIVKSILLAATMPFAYMNLRSSRAGLKLRLPFVRSELSIVTVIVVAAAVLTTLPPPGRGATTQVAAGPVPVIAQPGTTTAAEPDGPDAGEPTPPPALDVGPGPVDSALQPAPPYLGIFSLDPNGPGRTNEVRMLVSRSDEPLSGATVTATFRHVESGSAMPVRTIVLQQTAVGVYVAKTDALLVAGTWVVTIKVTGVGETVPRLRYRVHVAPA
ncbi:MAG: copper transport protein [Gaiellaceae bacterium]|nr:copper transport protein [Gaiellaceae bacterium]